MFTVIKTQDTCVGIYRNALLMANHQADYNAIGTYELYAQPLTSLPGWMIGGFTPTFSHNQWLKRWRISNLFFAAEPKVSSYINNH